MPIAVSLLLFGLAGVNAFLPTRAISRTTMSTTTQLGISEALGRYIDEEYYRENHKEEYNMQWVHQNKAAILYHTHDGDLVLGDPHLDFQTHTEHTESPQHYVATHPQVRHSICDTQKSMYVHKFDLF